MKKLTAMMIGLGLMLGVVSFAQDAPKADTEKSAPKTKKKGGKKSKKAQKDEAKPADATK